MKQSHVLFAMLIGLFLLVGCSVGRKMSFEEKKVAPDYASAKSMLVSFQDQRPDVLSGKEKPSFCGHMKSTGQIEYNMQTESGKPLAEEFTNAVSKGLTEKQLNNSPLVVTHLTSFDSIRQAFTSSGKERLVFFTIRKWEAEETPTFTTIKYEVLYDLKLDIYDQSGQLLASETTQDIFVDKKGVAGSVKVLQQLADEIFQTQVKALFNREKIRASLLQ
ncbi:hypothetical protein KJS94_13720 [Flavihumibacter rivuli]|uniref:hypothetical protein n=1 Tax=Flavihumibacter rivuli TaxID=2838156 RepID=UPI001BDE0546|nr:hypothetical protein [Flavihumibacter rivuli]ULQ55703.1 hypothetical protein KJS94_13720 [Flavihumibacter rivuli]